MTYSISKPQADTTDIAKHRKVITPSLRPVMLLNLVNYHWTMDAGAENATERAQTEEEGKKQPCIATRLSLARSLSLPLHQS